MHSAVTVNCQDSCTTFAVNFKQRLLRVPLENLTAAQLLGKFSTFYDYFCKVPP